MIFNIFGSENSEDYDVFVPIVDMYSNKEKNKQHCKYLELELENILKDKSINVNIGTVSSGLIDCCYKGDPWEVNNSIFKTYQLHYQYHPKIIKDCLEINKSEKIKRCLRTVLTFLSRTQYRDLVKVSLKGSIGHQIDTLSKIDLSKIKTFKKKIDDKSVWKKIAFQLSQTFEMVVLESSLYTKNEAAHRYPEISCFLYKKDYTNHKGINSLKDELMSEIKHIDEHQNQQRACR